MRQRAAWRVIGLMSESLSYEPAHVVVVIGAATSGSEIARILAERRATVIVIRTESRAPTEKSRMACRVGM